MAPQTRAKCTLGSTSSRATFSLRGREGERRGGRKREGGRGRVREREKSKKLWPLALVHPDAAQ